MRCQVSYVTGVRTITRKRGINKENKAEDNVNRSHRADVEEVNGTQANYELTVSKQCLKATTQISSTCLNGDRVSVDGMQRMETTYELRNLEALCLRQFCKNNRLLNEGEN